MPGDGSALGPRQPSATNSFAGVFARRRLAGQPSRRTRAGLRAGDTGFSLVELILAAALTAIMGAMALMWLFTVNRTATDFTAEQQAENDLRHILELAVGEMADARPPARCDDDPPPADADSCQVWIDHWDVAAVGVPIYSANARQLCFYALAASGSPPDPSNTDPPALEGRCLRAKDDRLEIVIADVDYDDQFVSTRPTPAADSDAPTRVLGYGLDGSGVFRYSDFDGATRTVTSDVEDISAVEITLRTDDVTLRAGDSGREMSATLAVRANRFSPFQTPLYTRPGQVTLGSATVTDDSITVSWTAPSTGGEPTGYLVQWKLSTAADFTDEREVPSDETMLTITGLTTDATYNVRVTAVNAVGSSSPSEVDATPVTTMPPPTMPTTP